MKMNAILALFLGIAAGQGLHDPAHNGGTGTEETMTPDRPMVYTPRNGSALLHDPTMAAGYSPGTEQTEPHDSSDMLVYRNGTARAYDSQEEYSQELASNPRAQWQMCAYHDECNSGCCLEPRHAFAPISRKRYRYDDSDESEDEESEDDEYNEDEGDRRRLQSMLHQQTSGQGGSGPRTVAPLWDPVFSNMTQTDRDNYGFDQPKYCLREAVCEAVFENHSDERTGKVISVLIFFFLVGCIVAQRVYYRRQMERIQSTDSSPPTYSPQQIPTATPVKQGSCGTDYVRQVSTDSLGVSYKQAVGQPKQNYDVGVMNQI